MTLRNAIFKGFRLFRMKTMLFIWQHQWMALQSLFMKKVDSY